MDMHNLGSEGHANLQDQQLVVRGREEDGTKWSLIVHCDMEFRNAVRIWAIAKWPDMEEDSTTITMRPDHAVELIARLRRAHAWTTDDVQVGNLWACHGCGSIFQREQWVDDERQDVSRCDNCENKGR